MPGYTCVVTAGSAEEGTAHGLRVGFLQPRFPGVRNIAVLRCGGLGDLLYAVPAMQSLADAYPGARLTLLTTVAHAEFLAGRPGPVHDVMALPTVTGVSAPEDVEEDPSVVGRFLLRARERGFHLAVQLHGGGRWSNPFVRRLGAPHTVGCRTPDAVALSRWIPYRYYQNEVMRALEVVGLAGAAPTSLQPTIAVTPADAEAAAAALAGLPRPLLTVHPGARDARRRWPVERFADVAASAVREGAGVAIVGSAEERDLVQRVDAAVRERVPSAPGVRVLPGTLSAAGLVGVLAASDVVLANDSGPRHLAQAVGAATVGLFWMGNVISAGPLERARQRLHVSWTPACQICGASYTDPAAPRCVHEESALTDIEVPEVLADVQDLLRVDRLARSS